jgi:hypothetical protein
MKLIRLPSGPLAFVFPIQQERAPSSERGKDSGIYRAFSGSVEADGESEDQAIEALDERVRRLSQAPPAPLVELARPAANDVSAWSGPGIADASVRHHPLSELDTMPAPTSSSRR